jgi:hypothetical protein
MDLIIQTSTQSHCHRIAKYFESRQKQHVFPAGPFADSAEEIGPLQSHTNGPCLLQFSNMQLTPQQFNAWFSGHFVERPCCRLYWLQRSVPAEPDKCVLEVGQQAAACTRVWGRGATCSTSNLRYTCTLCRDVFWPG